MSASILTLPYQKVHLVGTEYVFVQHILFCQGDRNYTHVYLTSGRKITISKTLRLIEERFQVGSFVRIHRSLLINSYHISYYDGHHVFLTNGTRQIISRRRRKKVRENLHTYTKHTSPKELNSTSKQALDLKE